MKLGALRSLELWVGILLVLYLLAVGIGSAVVVILNFPGQTADGAALQFPAHDADGLRIWPFGALGSPDQGLLALAFLAGVAGSFLHAAQSLSSYLGNGVFKTSWTAWYFLRPPIGGVLGFAIYFVIRAGLVSGGEVVNPYGLVSLGLLGGWFSKTTTDKLQEVFETLFRTQQDEMRGDKLHVGRPSIEHFVPDPVPPEVAQFKIVGDHFQSGAVASVGGRSVGTRFVSEQELQVLLADGDRPAAGSSAPVRVKNPRGAKPLSDEARLAFE